MYTKIFHGIIQQCIGYEKGKSIDVGFLNYGKKPLASMGMWIAEQSQEGAKIKTGEYGSMMRRFFARLGGRLSKRSKFRRFFFIRRNTKFFDVPPREVIDPFWARYSAQALKNITANFERKLRGERI